MILYNSSLRNSNIQTNHSPHEFSTYRERTEYLIGPFYAGPYYATAEFRSFLAQPLFNAGPLRRPLLRQRRKNYANKGPYYVGP